MKVEHIQLSVIVGLLVLLVTCTRSGATAKFGIPGALINKIRITRNAVAQPPQGNYAALVIKSIRTTL